MYSSNVMTFIISSFPQQHNENGEGEGGGSNDWQRPAPTHEHLLRVISVIRTDPLKLVFGERGCTPWL